MSSFDYSAPAELFLSKPAKGCRTKYRRFATAAEALRFAVDELRIPEAFALGLRSGMSASAVAKFNACTKPKTIRCASLSDRMSARRRWWGLLGGQISRFDPHLPDFKLTLKGQ